MADSHQQCRCKRFRELLTIFFVPTGIYILLERVILDDTVEGVPVLMLANKQDVPTALRLESIKEIFNQIAERLGARDSRVLPISALEG